MSVFILFKDNKVISAGIDMPDVTQLPDGDYEIQRWNNEKHEGTICFGIEGEMVKRND